jgi:hypothetical protein
MENQPTPITLPHDVIIVDGVPEATVLLDKPRRLRLDFNAMAEIERTTGKTLFDQTLNLGGSARDLRVVLWACLNAANPSDELDLSEVGALVGFGGIKQTVESILTLIGMQRLTMHDDPLTLAPFVPTDDSVVEAMLNDAGLEPGQLLIDLGCGDGRIVFQAQQRGCDAVGVEADEGRFKACVEKLAKLGEPGEMEVEIDEHGDTRSAYCNGARFYRGYIQDFLQKEKELVGSADVVSLYLLTTSNNVLKPALRELMNDSARVVSHDFSMTGWKSRNENWVYVGTRRHGVYTYVVGEQPAIEPATTVEPPAETASEVEAADA